MKDTAFNLLAAPDLDDRPVEKRIGVVLLATDHTTERDMVAICPHERVGVYCNRVAYANPTTPENLLRMQPRLQECAAQILPGADLDAIYFSCMSASVTIGDPVIAKAIRQAKPGVAVITPALAARTAFATLGVSRISILTPYLRETSEPVARYFASHGFEVLNLDHFGLADDRDMARINTRSIIRAAVRATHADAQGLFISCTALAAAGVAQEIEAAIGRPVITSNQAGIWLALRRAGVRDQISGYGQIFEHDPAQGSAQ
jgi:maleate isomerase